MLHVDDGPKFRENRNLGEMILGVELAYEGKTKNTNPNSDMNMVQII